MPPGRDKGETKLSGDDIAASVAYGFETDLTAPELRPDLNQAALTTYLISLKITALTRLASALGDAPDLAVVVRELQLCQDWGSAVSAGVTFAAPSDAERVQLLDAINAVDAMIDTAGSIDELVAAGAILIKSLKAPD